MALKHRMIRISMIVALALVAVCGVADELEATAAPASESVAESSDIEQKVKKLIADTEIRQAGALKGHLLKPWPNKGLWRYENFALAAYWLNEKTEQADKELIEVCNEYAQKAAEEEQLHWHIYLMGRIYLLYSSESKYFPGRMSEAAEEAVLKFMYAWLEGHVTKEVPNLPVWDYWGSENHHIQKWASAWTAANCLKKIPEYRNKSCKDSTTVSELAVQMDTYFKNFLKERACKGLLAEIASSYAPYSINPIYNLYDFAEDKELKRYADLFLNIYFADYAIELLNGFRGGSIHRLYAGMWAFPQSLSLGYFSLGHGISSRHPSVAAAATTMWRPNELVVELAQSTSNKEAYNIISRRPGKADSKAIKGVNSMAAEGGSLLRYSWVTPQFIMGMSIVEALPGESWVAVSSQNRRNSILFSEDAKIFTQRPCPERGSVYNAEWGVQYQGVMILQMMSSARKLSKAANGQMIFFDSRLKRSEKDGWIFVESKDAYCAVKVVKGGGKWSKLEPSFFKVKVKPEGGEMFVLNDAHSPIIFEANSKDKFNSFEDFQMQILSNRLMLRGEKLTYKSKAYQNTLTLFIDYSKSPQINGKTIEFSPKYVYRSPYLNGEFGKGIVELTNGKKKVVFDFNKDIKND